MFTYICICIHLYLYLYPLVSVKRGGEGSGGVGGALYRDVIIVPDNPTGAIIIYISRWMDRRRCDFFFSPSVRRRRPATTISYLSTSLIFFFSRLFARSVLPTARHPYDAEEEERVCDVMFDDDEEEDGDGEEDEQVGVPFARIFGNGIGIGGGGAAGAGARFEGEDGEARRRRREIERESAAATDAIIDALAGCLVNVARCHLRLHSKVWKTSEWLNLVLPYPRTPQIYIL